MSEDFSQLSGANYIKAQQDRLAVIYTALCADKKAALTGDGLVCFCIDSDMRVNAFAYDEEALQRLRDFCNRVSHLNINVCQHPTGTTYIRPEEWLRQNFYPVPGNSSPINTEAVNPASAPH